MCVKLAPGGGRRILVTRPEPAASQTAQLLREAGYVPHVLPLSRTQPLAFDQDIAGFTAVTVTSVNAFRHVDAGFLAKLTHFPLFAVGVRTAQAARDFGFTQVIEGGGDAVRLAATMHRLLSRQDRVLYLAGRVRQPIFEELVADSGQTMAGQSMPGQAMAGLSMITRDVYDTVAIHSSVDALGDQAFSAVLLYSAVAAQALVDMMDGETSSAFGDETQFLCISQRVANILPKPWWTRCLIADHPDEDGLFRLFA